MRTGLTLWFATMVALLLATATIAARTVVRRTLAREATQRVYDTAHLVQRFYRTEQLEPDHNEPEATLRHVLSNLIFADRQLTIVSPDGRVIPGAATPVTLVAPVRTIEVSVDTARAPGWRLRVSASVADLAQLEQRFDIIAATGIGVTVLVAAAAGWWVAGRALARQRRFLADAAHELRTPVARMRARVEVALIEGDEHAGGVLPTLEALHSDLVQTSGLLDELLQLARADATPREARLELGYLDDVIADVLPAWSAAARRAAVTLRATRLEEAPARLDAGLVARLAGALLDNAIRYTPPGGIIDVRVYATTAAVLEVEDTGIGILEADRARVTERFFRGEAARAITPSGSGVGLAVAAWIVAQHGGALAFEPRPDGGTIVRASLPRVH